MKMPSTFAGSFKSGSVSPEMLKRISATVLIASCLMLVVWSLTFRLSLITEAQSQIHTPFSLSRQVDSLEQLWSDEEAKAINQEWSALKTRSFEDYNHLVTWVTRMADEAQDLRLAVTYRIDDESTPVEKVQEIHRIGMEWTIQAQNAQQGYPGFIQFLKELSEDEQKVNFEFIEFVGTGRGAQKMELRLHTFLQHAT